jgi:hypothetical protein
MNPPTTGHQLLVNKLVAHAHSSKSTPRVYLSHTTGKKDPLPYDKKITFARAAFGAIVRKSNARNVIDILKELEHEGFSKITMFVGSDRVASFTKLLNTYNGKEYTFEKIEVKSAGERDPDADDVSGMSASKMRALAKDDKAAEFLRGAPNTLKAAQAKNMFTAVRKAILGEDVMEYGHDERFLEFIFESDMKDDLTDLPSDGEISKHFHSLGADDLDLDDADAMMLDIILDREEDKEDIEEARVLNIQQRQKLAQRMKSMSKRLARLRQIKAKQMPAQQRLRMRARKAAIMLLRKRATGRKNLEYSSLSRSQRIAVDTALVQRFGKNLNSLVGRLATRLMPRVRKHAQEYMKKSREETKESFVYEAKEKEGSAKDVAQDKVQAAKRGMSVSDWEKTKADAAHDSPLNIDATKLNNLGIDPTKNDRSAPNPKQGHLHLNRKLSHYARVDEGRKSSADKDARDAGDTNIIYQMRKIINSRGEHETTFADGKKANVSIADAKKMIAKFEALRLPADKHEFTVQAGKSLASFKDVMAHGVKHEKKKISLGGNQFKEFYMGVGRTRTISPYDGDEPPGTRRVAEAAKDEDRPEDPNRSRPLSQKLDLLLRLGLADTDDLQKYRRALRSSKKAALQSPEMRSKLADLLDKLIDLTTQDPATYSRVRYRVQTKEAMSLLNKAEKSGVDVEIIFEVFARGYEENEDINEAFNRVNSFIAGGKAAEMDKDLSEKVKEPTGGLKDACWSGYTAVGMKMKNGRKVPNCVPKEEAKSDAQQRAAGAALATQRGEYEGGKKGGAINRMALMKTKDLIKLAKKKKEVNEVVVSRKMTPAEKKAHASYVAKFKHRVAAATPDDKPAKKTMKDISKISHSDYTHQPSKMASVGYDRHEQNMTTHDAVPLAKRAKRVKSFHAWHPKMTEATQRHADIKMVKVRMPDGSIKYRKEKAAVAVQHEAKSHPHPTVQKTHPHPTGKVPYGSMTDKELRDALPKKVKAASEAYTGSEPTTGNMADPANRFVGTNAIRQNYANVTPGQGSAAGEIAVAKFAPEKVDYTSSMAKKTRTEVDQSKDNMSKKHLGDIRKALGGIRESHDLNESFAAGFELAPLARDYGIKIQSAFEHHPEVQAQIDAQEAIYQGRSVQLNKPMQGDVKKSKVYVRDPSTGNVKKVNFGDKTLSIKKDQPARKRSYCARSGGQGNLTKKTSANYWSRRAWNC